MNPDKMTWMNFKIIMLSISRQKRSTFCIVLLIQNSRENNLDYNERKQINGFLEVGTVIVRGEWKREIIGGHEYVRHLLC